MVRYLVIPIILLLAVSCEKPVNKGEYGNPLLRFYGDAKEDIGYSIAETSDGYLLCGKLTVIERGTNEAGSSIIIGENEEFGLIKTDRQGVKQWVYTTGGPGFDEGRKVLVLDDGSIVCAGTATVYNHTSVDMDVLVTKISATGTLVWEHHWGGDFNQMGYDIIRDVSSGGFLVVGSNDDDENYQNNPGKRDMFFLSINENGDSLRSYTAGYPGDEYAERIIYNSGNNYIVAGTTDRSESGTPGQAGLNIMIVNTTPYLSNPDVKIYGGANDEVVSDIVEVGSGYSIAGTIVYGSDSRDGLFVNMSSGTLPVTVNFSTFNLGSNVVSINSLYPVTGSGFIAAGSTGGTEQSGDMLFMFLDSNGQNVAAPEKFITGGTGFQTVNDLIVDSQGKVVAVGTNTYENNSLVTLLKFDPWEN